MTPGPRKPRIGLLRGDPSGIGPEVAAKLLEIPQAREGVDVVALGDTPPDCAVGIASAGAGRYVLDSLRLACEVIRRGEIDALVYAPLNKQAMKMAGLAVRPRVPNMCWLSQGGSIRGPPSAQESGVWRHSAKVSRRTTRCGPKSGRSPPTAYVYSAMKLCVRLLRVP